MSETPLTRLVAEPEESRRQKGTLHTPEEILQQPSVWRETARSLVAQTPRLSRLFHEAPSLLMTGAGSSLHAARMIEMSARSWLGPAVQVLSCTDLMIAPEIYLSRKGEGILLSLSRSGKSPEISEAARRVAAWAPKTGQLALTCAQASPLNQVVEGTPRGQVWVLPERANDRGTATTGSTTSTVVAGRYLVSLIHPQDPNGYVERTDVLAQVAEELLREHAATAEELARTNPGRVAVLGGLPLEGAAQEIAHKILELTDGQVPAIAKNYLEFRHGPIAFVDRSTTVLCLVSSQEPLVLYERDFIRQLKASGTPKEIVVLGSEKFELFEGQADRIIPFPAGTLTTGERGILSLVFGQMLALFLSLHRGLLPDTPCARGLVNPVVQGVTIYPLKERP
jgi:tagatose-6-phosphate ketose/aldose isomerase